MGVIQRKQRWATEGVRFQRHNPDGSIPSPQRFIGFANDVDLTKVLTDGIAPLTIKVDHNAAVTRSVSFENVLNKARVTPNEAVQALNGAGFNDFEFSVDAKTGRLKGSYASGSYAQITVSFTNETGFAITIPAMTYSFTFNGTVYQVVLKDAVSVPDEEIIELIFIAVTKGVKILPQTGEDADISIITPSLPGAGDSGFVASFTSAANGTASEFAGKIIQVTGKLAAALDFGQGLKQGGNGLEVINFFDDETISVGLPKDIKDKEEIDSEGAKGTITRMIIGATIQGMSPVVTLKQKDYYFIELVQGGKLDRETGAYDPPSSHDSDPPTFWGELFSPVYSVGSNKVSDVAGYERILWRTMIGIEGDVPVDAKGWAQYAYNLTSTEYTDENDNTMPAWQEQTLTVEQFDALRVKGV